MREVGAGEIMIVEDDLGVREALTDLLRGEGYRVSGLSNGRDAMAELRSRVVVPGLMIVDLLMPIMDGRELCATLRLHPALARIPVVVMSADAHLRHHAGSLEAAAFLKKPLDIPKLLATIEAHLA
jgi:two-component system alkaline phosphatase synthesis response regulator PhoP